MTIGNAKTGGIRMPFGKWRGYLLQEIDEGYLLWLVTDCPFDLREPLKTAVNRELEDRRTVRREEREWEAYFAAEERNNQASPQRPDRNVDPATATEIVTRGHRVLAKEHHPDHGGDTRRMQRINSAADWLKTAVTRALGNGSKDR